MTTPPKNASLQEFFIEVLGIDGRGFRLMRDIFLNPHKVFDAYFTDNQQLCAPPIRVWLWVFGVKTLMLVFIGGAGGMFSRINDAQQHERNFGALLERVGVDLSRFLELAGTWWNVFHPILVLLLSIPAAFMFTLLQRNRCFADHANIYLSAYLAASIVSLFLVPLVFLLAPSAAGLLGVLNAVVFGITFARGGAAAPYFTTKFGAIVKSVFVSVAFFMTTAIASFILLWALVGYAAAFPGN